MLTLLFGEVPVPRRSESANIILKSTIVFRSEDREHSSLLHGYPSYERTKRPIQSTYTINWVYGIIPFTERG